MRFGDVFDTLAGGEPKTLEQITAEVSGKTGNPESEAVVKAILTAYVNGLGFIELRPGTDSPDTYILTDAGRERIEYNERIAKYRMGHK